jgi:hypothetical protein
MQIQDQVQNIQRMISDGAQTIREHPFMQTASDWTAGQRARYALYQFVTAMVWPAFLSTASAAAQNPKLKKALRLNAAGEAGAEEGSVGHTALAYRFCSSQGLTDGQMVGELTNPRFLESVGEMFAITAAGDEFMAGRLCSSEAFAGVMFEEAQPAFSQIVGCDLTYMTEHVEVDNDEHSAALLDAIEDILSGGGSYDEVVRGVNAGIALRRAYLEYIRVGNNPSTHTLACGPLCSHGSRDDIKELMAEIFSSQPIE